MGPQPAGCVLHMKKGCLIRHSRRRGGLGGRGVGGVVARCACLVRGNSASGPNLHSPGVKAGELAVPSPRLTCSITAPGRIPHQSCAHVFQRHGSICCLQGGESFLSTAAEPCVGLGARGRGYSWSSRDVLSDRTRDPWMWSVESGDMKTVWNIAETTDSIWRTSQDDISSGATATLLLEEVLLLPIMHHGSIRFKHPETQESIHFE